MTFKELHYQESPLILFNVWDIPSVKLAEKLNFDAVGTSSAAIASMLGYDDGEKISFPELEYIIKRIMDNTQLPVSVDLEAGYGKSPDQVLKNIKKLANTGILGINIEDSIVNKNRSLTSRETFCELIRLAKDYLERNGIKMFLNVRTDAFLLGVTNPVNETKKRIRSYEAAGADGIFTPGIVSENHIEEIVNYTKLPINVMCMPTLPDFDRLAKLGVKRISMGNFMFDYMYLGLSKVLEQLVTDKSFKFLF